MYVQNTALEEHKLCMLSCNVTCFYIVIRSTNGHTTASRNFSKKCEREDHLREAEGLLPRTRLGGTHDDQHECETGFRRTTEAGGCKDSQPTGTTKAGTRSASQQKRSRAAAATTKLEARARTSEVRHTPIAASSEQGSSNGGQGSCRFDVACSADPGAEPATRR